MRADQMPKPWPPSEPELLPCPFCGADAEVRKKATVLVACTGCTATTFQQFGDQSSAIATWNRRAPSEHPQ